MVNKKRKKHKIHFILIPRIFIYGRRQMNAFGGDIPEPIKNVWRAYKEHTPD